MLSLNACAFRPHPNLQAIYNRAAKDSHLNRNPLIVIPGLLGSRLIDEESGREVWGIFSGKYANPTKPDGARLIALPMKKGAPLRELRDRVKPAGVLEIAKAKIFGWTFESRTYFNLLAVLGAGGYRDESLGLSGAIDYGEDHFTCFQFDYDFRRDTVENVESLHRFILEKQAYVKKELEKRFGVVDPQVKFDLVTHSMGGLLARYYLRYGTTDLPEDGSLPEVTWAGSQWIDRAIFIGPPNAGSLKGLKELVQGRKIGKLLPTIPPAVSGTFPAAYQMLPRGRHGVLVDAADPTKRFENVFSPELWERMKWGLADPKQEKVLNWLLPDVSDPALRREIALDHQKKCLTRAEQLARALDVPASPPKNLKLYLIAGDAEPTDSVMSVDVNSGRLEVLEQAPGDKTVLRSSALMDERVGGTWTARLNSPIEWTQVIFIFKDHLGLTMDPAFTDNILYVLLETP